MPGVYWRRIPGGVLTSSGVYWLMPVGAADPETPPINPPLDKGTRYTLVVPLEKMRLFGYL